MIWSPGETAGAIELVGMEKGCTNPNIRSMTTPATKTPATVAKNIESRLLALQPAGWRFGTGGGSGVLMCQLR